MVNLRTMISAIFVKRPQPVCPKPVDHYVEVHLPSLLPGRPDPVIIDGLRQHAGTLQRFDRPTGAPDNIEEMVAMYAEQPPHEWTV